MTSSTVKRNIPNVITSLRIVGTVLLLRAELLSLRFFILYAITGITDALDGFLARKLKVSSSFGAKLDSISDLLFYTVLLIRLLPTLWDVLLPQYYIWYVVALTVALRLFCYGYVAFKYKCFSSMHTYLNKLTGLVVFCVPFALLASDPKPWCWVVVAVATLASLEELLMQLLSKKYQMGKKTLLQMLKK